jgi:elongation of very long chain fatty acids protein 4
MMYSYYALSLLKIRCPWKKYLTMAQLAQFLSVLIYSAVSIINMPVEANWKHYAAYCTQVFEMTSLFVLFMHFYRKAYSDKQKQPKQMTASDNDSTSAACSSVSSESSEDAPSTDS